jgi:two-component system LytT family response regulator
VRGPLRVVVADDERPARSFLLALLRQFDDVEVVGEAATGTEAVALIEREHPDLALLDLQMPELDGLGVVRNLSKARMPLVAFVTAYDEYAVQAFEANAVDYLLKPVERARLRETLERARERLERDARPAYLERVPVRHRGEIVLVPVDQVASVVAEGELLHLTTSAGERYTITHRLKDLEERLEPDRFVRLGRGTLARIDQIAKISPMPGGTYVVTLANGQQLPVSRMQSRVIRDQLLRL